MDTSQPGFKRFSSWMQAEFQFAALLNSISAGAILYMLEVIFVMAMGALLFSGPLAGQIGLGVGCILLGNGLLMGLMAIFSSFPGNISAQQDAPGIVIAVSIAAVLSALPGSAPPEQRLAIALVVIASVTLLTGLFLTLLGLFNLGGLVRFLPYPVIGGFLAGTGWLLFSGGIASMLDVPFGPAIFQAALLPFWLPGLGLGCLLLLVSSRVRHPLALPAAFLAVVGAFYALAAAAGIPLTRLAEDGWLLGGQAAQRGWVFPLSPALLSQVDWAALLRQAPFLLPLPLISAISLLLNANGLELIIKKDLNLNRELVATGAANLVAGLFGGLPGYLAISLSALNHSLSGGARRLPGLVAAGLLLITGSAGVALISYLPRFALGGLVVFLGLGLLLEWVVKAWFKLPRVDFLIISLILGIIMAGAFLQALAVGLILTVILFAVSYSQVNVIQHAMLGSSFRSRVTRSPTQQSVLNQQGSQLLILKLGGFIFFGTAHSILEQVQAQAQSGPTPIRYVLLDFARVSGLDSTGMLSFSKLLDFSRGRQMTLVLAGLHGRAAAQFARHGFQESPGLLHHCADLDHGAEWCEEQILEAAGALAADQHPLAQQLAELLPGIEAQAPLLVNAMQRRELAAGEYLFRQGDPPDFVFLIESGQVTAQLEIPGEPPLRLETMRSGRTIGELGFYLNTPRAASVQADEPSVIYQMSHSALADIESQHPAAALAFHRLFTHLMGERVIHLMNTVNALRE